MVSRKNVQIKIAAALFLLVTTQQSTLAEDTVPDKSASVLRAYDVAKDLKNHNQYSAALAVLQKLEPEADSAFRSTPNDMAAFYSDMSELFRRTGDQGEAYIYADKAIDCVKLKFPDNQDPQAYAMPPVVEGRP